LTIFLLHKITLSYQWRHKSKLTAHVILEVDVRQAVAYGLSVCMFVCLCVCACSTALSFQQNATKKYCYIPNGPPTWRIDFKTSRSKVKVRKNHWKSEIPYLLTWADFQKFISLSNIQVLTSNFIYAYIWSSSIDLTILVRIRKQIRELWRHMFIMGNAI
jgi:hypothetical protein